MNNGFFFEDNVHAKLINVITINVVAMCLPNPLSGFIIHLVVPTNNHIQQQQDKKKKFVFNLS
jgi:hypothetical protein